MGLKKKKLFKWKSRQAELRELIDDLNAIRREMVDLEARFNEELHKLHGASRKSAYNLIHHLALRNDRALHLRGRLESLGVFFPDNSEHIMAGIDRALHLLERLALFSYSPLHALRLDSPEASCAALVEMRTEELLGKKPCGRRVRIMVTVPTEAASDPRFIHDLLQRGMDCMRINCAHDNPEVWSGMIANLERARQKLGRPCSLLMDIPGPKLRTGAVEAGPQVLKVHPHRDYFGEVTAPARIWITSAENPDAAPSGADATLAVRADWLGLSSVGDTIYFEDARGSARSLRVSAIEGRNRWAESMRTAYIVPETVLHLSRLDRGALVDATATVKNIPRREQSIHVRLGDTLIITADSIFGRPAKYDDQGRLLCPANIGITCTEIFEDVRRGEVIWIDDGKLGGVIRSVKANQMSVEITHARARGENLRADKGINLPESNLRLPPLTAKDIKILNFIARHADMVGYSFVRDEKDLRELQRRLRAAGARDLGIILKIETRKALEHLPELLLASIRHGRVGIMIARGDLAVECGFEKLAHSQEHILSMARTAHIPVIWATQVLENLAKKGMPSRAEITDAAMASRAQCVMLNKGPYILDAMTTLDDVLRQAEAQHAIAARASRDSATPELAHERVFVASPARRSKDQEANQALGTEEGLITANPALHLVN